MIFNRLLRAAIDSNRKLCDQFDRLILSPEWSIDGNQTFRDSLLPAALQHAALVYDVGGGRHPAVTIERKQSMALRVVGVDISEPELSLAPPGHYDTTVCADVCTIEGKQDGDLAICQTLLEHVADTEQALRGIASLVRPGGRVLVFAPSRRALFALLNRHLPEHFKRATLFAIFPESQGQQGFPSYYDRCTERELRESGSRAALDVEFVHRFWVSKYFSFSLPLYVAWRSWMVAHRRFAGDSAAETFAIAFRKRAT